MYFKIPILLCAINVGFKTMVRMETFPDKLQQRAYTNYVSNIHASDTRTIVIEVTVTFCNKRLLPYCAQAGNESRLKSHFVIIGSITSDTKEVKVSMKEYSY